MYLPRSRQSLPRLTIFFGGQTMKWFRDHMWRRKIGMFVLDLVLITLSVYLSMELRFEMYIPYRHVETMMRSMPVIWIAYMGCYIVGGIYQIMWRYAGVRDTTRLCLLSGVACGITLAANQFLNLGLFRGVLILIALIATISIGGVRMLWRVCSKDRIPGGLGDAVPCCSPWGLKESNMTERLNSKEGSMK